MVGPVNRHKSARPVRHPASLSKLLPSKGRRLRIGFALVPRFTLIAFAGFVDALRLAADESDLSRQIHCEWTILGARGAFIESSCGVAVQTTSEMERAEQFDYIVVVGGLMHGGQTVLPGTNGFLRDGASKGVSLIALCTGTFVLARAGLLRGYECCVSWFHRDDFGWEFPTINVQSKFRFIVDRDRWTCAGGTGVVHLAAYLIERHLGRPQAVKSLRILLEDAPLPDNAGQPESVVTHRSHDSLVRQAMLIIEQNLSSSEPLRKLLDPLRVGLRQIERRFVTDVGMSPREYRRQLRLSRAKWMLEKTDDSVTQVSLNCGYSDASHFARTIRKHFNSSPSDVRFSAQK
jgi:transcriptional regulator GlxA family with amidase domain